MINATCTKKREKVNTLFNITKAHKCEEKLFSANKVSGWSQDNRRVIIGRKETCLTTEKNVKKRQKKLRNIVSIFANFCHIAQQKCFISTQL